jgi:uncharacterized membrane protein YphA (DoxX/SURF4 family)
VQTASEPTLLEITVPCPQIKSGKPNQAFIPPSKPFNKHFLKHDQMPTTVWVLKALLALIFIFVGINKLTLPKAKLLDKGMKGLINLDEKQIKFAGFLEISGAIGLVLPTLTNIYPVLSGIAAVCLGLTMLVALYINLKLRLSIIPNIVILVICIFIAYWELK